MRLHTGMYGHQAFALKVDWEKKPLPHRGIEPASAACRSDAVSTEPHPFPSAKPVANSNCKRNERQFIVSVAKSVLPANCVSAGLPSRSGDVAVYVLDVNQPILPTLFILFLCLFLSLCPFQLYFIP